MNNSKSDFTKGSISKKLISILGALILQAAYGAVDLLVVGRFGTTSGLSAVSTGSQVLNLVTFVITQLAMGITVLIARYIGEKKPETIGSLIGGATVVFAIISIVFCNGVLRTSDFCTDAGTSRGGCLNSSLCAHLRRGYLFYRCI